MPSISFPENFVWGAATASYQIEGAAHEDGRGESIWDRFSHTPGKVVNGDTGDVACDHYHRMPQDVEMMAELGLKAYRFSIAWPRLFPSGSGPLNQAGLDFYNRLTDRLLGAGITPMATLYHWDLPQTLEDAGGWTNLDTAERFADYAQVAFEAMGDRVKHWLTLNEPWCSAYLGYGNGEHAPGRKDWGACMAAGHTLLVAHGLAMQRFRDAGQGGQIGITVNLAPTHAATDSAADRGAAARWDAFMNRWFLDPIYKGDYPAALREAFGDQLPQFTDAQRAAVQSPMDLLGVNYYSRAVMADNPGNPPLRTAGRTPPGVPVTAMGWEVYPDGLREILVWLRDNYNNPVLYVTENGAAYNDQPGPDGVVPDQDREDYLRAHFEAARRAIDQGVNLAGYFVWSLMDNFEWAFGYTKRFGIVRVDYPTEQRTPKQSARWYAGVIARNGV